MLVRDLLADFFIKGLPAIGAAGGGVYAYKEGGPWWKTLGLVSAGWVGGWGASRMLQWGIDRMTPGLPSDNTELVEAGTGYEGEPTAQPGPAPAAVSGLRYINLEEEKARLKQEAIEKRRARRGTKVTLSETGQVVPVSAKGSETATQPTTALAIVPLAIKPSMMYGGLRIGKNVLGVSRPSK